MQERNIHHSTSSHNGGSEIDRGWDIAVNSVGEAYITGTTESLDFPSTPGSQEYFPCDGEIVPVELLKGRGERTKIQILLYIKSG